MQHKNNFNFLRLLLAVLVLLSHSYELIDGNRNREILTRIFNTISLGELAVDSFFLISGYLILQSWERSPKLQVFLKKRILRIYPGFIVASLVSAYVVGPLGAATDYFADFQLFQFFKSLVLLQPPNIPPVFPGQPYPFVNSSMWTISYEFRCYLMVALIGICGLLSWRIWLALSALTLVMALSPDSARPLANLSWVLVGEPVSLIHFLCFFFAGGCFYLFRDRIHYRFTWVLVLIPILLLSLFNTSTAQLLLPTIGAYILFWAAFAPAPILQRVGSYPDISYGVYLYGWPVQKLLLWYCPSLSPWLLFMLSCGISFVCGLLSWHLVEKPFLQLKRAPAQKHQEPTPTLLMSAEKIKAGR